MYTLPLDISPKKQSISGWIKYRLLSWTFLTRNHNTPNITRSKTLCCDLFQTIQKKINDISIIYKNEMKSYWWTAFKVSDNLNWINKFTGVAVRICMSCNRDSIRGLVWRCLPPSGQWRPATQKQFFLELNFIEQFVWQCGDKTAPNIVCSEQFQNQFSTLTKKRENFSPDPPPHPGQCPALSGGILSC